MSMDGTLFGDSEASDDSGDAQEIAASAIPDWQVAQLRGALDALGLETMAERQQVVQDLVGRPVASLRDLQRPEVRVLLDALRKKASSGSESPTGSAWDTRGEETWIDRL